VKYLGEEGKHRHTAQPITAAVAVSCPWTFEQTHIAEASTQPHHTLAQKTIGRAYMLLITAGLKLYLAAHKHGAELRKHTDVQLDKALKGGSIADFDSYITVPMWGYEVSRSTKSSNTQCTLLSGM
jgi:predicted alpha/beta-fold hydrolase